MVTEEEEAEVAQEEEEAAVVAEEEVAHQETECEACCFRWQHQHLHMIGTIFIFCVAVAETVA